MTTRCFGASNTGDGADAGAAAEMGSSVDTGASCCVAQAETNRHAAHGRSRCTANWALATVSRGKMTLPR